MNNQLVLAGFNDYFQGHAAAYPDQLPARVIRQDRELYRVLWAEGESAAVVSGRLDYHADAAAAYPAVGDWVMIDPPQGGRAVIRQLLRRRSVFARKAAGTGRQAQVVAANIDTVFVCMSLNADFNLRRAERYLSAIWEGGATPVAVLTKSDLCADIAGALADIALLGVEAVTCSAVTGEGVQALRSYLENHRTIAFVGSSGVGKSTLINRLMDREVMATSGIRESDDKGRHTTTHRQLFLVPGGGVVIDTPGMRELQLEGGDLSATFADIAELAVGCRFRDCSHTTEPGCAVRSAVEEGALPADRLDSFHKLQVELGYQGLDSRKLERRKLDRMFGGTGAYKTAMREIKAKDKRR